MSTLSKQRFMVGLVFSFFLTIGFSASLLVVGLSENDAGTKIANKSVPETSIVVSSREKNLDLIGMHARK